MKIIIFCLIAIILVSSVLVSSEALSDKKQTVSPQYKCKGKALCINGTVTKIVDGDTLNVKEIKNGKLHKIRLSLTSTPELNTMKGVKASIFLKKICPAGSNVLVDQDDGQIGGSYDRMLGKVICDSKNLNAELLSSGHAKISKQFCKKSEFANEDWAKSVCKP